MDTLGTTVHYAEAEIERRVEWWVGEVVLFVQYNCTAESVLRSADLEA